MGSRRPHAHIVAQCLGRTDVVDQPNMVQLIQLHLGVIHQLRHDRRESGIQKGGALLLYLDHRPINIHLLVSETRPAIMKKTQHWEDRGHMEHG